jgi:hypothetical protein
MFFAVFIELGPFTYMFILFIVVFTIVSIIIQSKVSEDGDYPGVHPYLRILIQTFRVSIGDL